MELLFSDRAGAVGSDSLEDGLKIHVPLLPYAGLHGTAGDDETGDVHPSHGHQHSGSDLVAVGYTDPSVESMTFDHDLAAIRYDLP